MSLSKFYGLGSLDIKLWQAEFLSQSHFSTIYSYCTCISETEIIRELFQVYLPKGLVSNKIQIFSLCFTQSEKSFYTPDHIGIKINELLLLFLGFLLLFFACLQLGGRLWSWWFEWNSPKFNILLWFVSTHIVLWNQNILEVLKATILLHLPL